MSTADRTVFLIESMRERGRGGLQEMVVDTLKTISSIRRVIWYHTHDSRHSPAGYPDVIAIYPDTGRVVVAELKREKTQPTFEQIEWLNAFSATPAEVYLWRPSHFYGGQIHAVLTGRAGGPAEGRWVKS